MAKLPVITILILCLHWFSVTFAANIPKSRINSTAQLIDLDFDSLLKVSSFLTAEDLLNLSQANSRLSEAANYAFRYYSGKIIHITDKNEESLNEVTPDPEDRDMRQSVAKLKRIFLNSTEARTILPRVGESINKMIIDFWAVNEPQKLLDTIVDCCSNTLISMTWRGGRDLDFGLKLNKPLPSIKNLSIDGIFGDTNVFEFNKWFPGMESVRLPNRWDLRSNVELLHRHFPNLRHVTLTIDKWNDGLLYSDFEIVLQKNRQIRSLNIERCYEDDKDLDIFEFIEETLPELEELSWGSDVYDLLERKIVIHDGEIVYVGSSVKFNNLKKFNGYFSYFDFFKTTFIFENSLQQLSMKLASVTPETVEFIRENSDISVLKVECFEPRGIFQLAELLNEIAFLLPKLTELYLIGYQDLFQFTHVLGTNSMDSLNIIQHRFSTDSEVHMGNHFPWNGCPDHLQFSMENVQVQNGYEYVFTCERNTTYSQ